ncbi:MAG TPA: methyltransferase domain-containing protein [Solirubrobacteraceae bacterium]|nr:methyltransferase domain-containing protein [Solirubrobacteraceae bacterium]
MRDGGGVDGGDGDPVSYDRARAAEGDMWGELRAVLDAGAVRVCDVGGGARPLLALDQVERYGLHYVVTDVSEQQLERAGGGYRREQLDILDDAGVARVAAEHGPFDAVFSRWTAEHVPDGEGFHRHVYELLRPGGTAVHMFPTLYALPFLVNRILSPGLSSRVLFRACPSRHAKFRPYYSWCRGPSRAQLARLRSVGFSVERYTGYYGHAFYRHVKPLAAAERAFVGVMVEHPLPALTSFALVVVRRPA